MKRLLTCLVATSVVATGLLVGSNSVKAETRHPHPTYADTWNFGVTNDGWAYSHYYLEAPVRLGSSATVTDFWGNVKSYKAANYGWAIAGAKKNWDWIQAKAYYGWYWF
ncbi:TPA: bacteriocin, lactococcin 972 family protein [Streptococcus suis]